MAEETMRTRRLDTYSHYYYLQLLLPLYGTPTNSALIMFVVMSVCTFI